MVPKCHNNPIFTVSANLCGVGQVFYANNGFNVKLVLFAILYF